MRLRLNWKSQKPYCEVEADMDHSMSGKKAALDIVPYPRDYHPDDVQVLVRLGEDGGSPGGSQRLPEPQECVARILGNSPCGVAGYLPGRADMDHAVPGAKTQFDVIQTQ